MPRTLLSIRAALWLSLLQLAEDVEENLVSQDSTNPGTFDITDRFRTRNQFNGVDLGWAVKTTRGRGRLMVPSVIVIHVKRRPFPELPSRIRPVFRISNSRRRFPCLGLEFRPTQNEFAVVPSLVSISAISSPTICGSPSDTQASGPMSSDLSTYRFGCESKSASTRWNLCIRYKPTRVRFRYHGLLDKGINLGVIRV